MNIALLHPYPVHRAAPGGTTRVHALVRHLAPRHRVSVFAHASGDGEIDSQAVAELARLGVDQHLAALPRASLAARLGWALGRTPYFVQRNRNPALEARLGDLDRRTPFDVLHVEFAYLAPLLDAAGPSAVRVLAEQETASLAIERLARVPFRRRRAYDHYLRLSLGKVLRYERRALAAFDRAFGITTIEARRLSAAAGRDVPVLPHVVCTRTFAPGDTTAPAADVLFVANYGHAPNHEALAWFAEEIWPRVHAARPAARCALVGPGLAPERWRRLARPGLDARGRVDDLVAHYRAASVVVNPVRSGAGMRGKVLEACASGCAVVSTTLGLEGVEARPGKHCLAADGAEGFAAAVLRYLDDAGLRREHGAAARALMQELYDPGVVFPRLEAAYAEAHARRQARTGR